jgi:7-carboxy-7-deazaguanine synthase
MTVPEIVARVREFPARHAVVTGGEPMIAKGIADLTLALRKHGLHITIETAGTIFAPVQCDLMSISPKLKNSTPDGEWARQHDKIRYQPEVLRHLVDLCDYQLKFVVSKPEDLDEIRTVMEATQAELSRVILMAEGTDPQRLRERALWIVEICKKEGYRYGPRIHVDIWGDKRGV